MEGHVDHIRASLPERYRSAFDAALKFTQRELTPDGILVSGTIMRGNPDPASDLDIVVIHHEPWRQRLQRVFDGVPAEIFVNPPTGIRRSFAQEAQAGRAVMAHMIATGQIIQDVSGIMLTLREEAAESLAAGPQLTDQDTLQRRYAIATSYEDAVDIIDRDPILASAMVIESVMNAARLAFLTQGRWLPRSKALFSDLDALDPDLSRQVREVIGASSARNQLTLARPIVQRIAGATGFFEWESDRQPIQ